MAWCRTPLLLRNTLQLGPHPSHQPLRRSKSGLIGHLPALGDPISEVKVGKSERFAALDLPQDVVGAEACSGNVGLEKRINGGESIDQAVDQAHHPQDALLAKLV